MRQIRQMLRLARDGVSAREIGRRLGIARSTVHDNLGRAAAAALVWPLGDDVTDAILEQRLFTHIGVKQGVRRRAEPDWPSLVREMRRPGVNLVVLCSVGTYNSLSSFTTSSGEAGFARKGASAKPSVEAACRPYPE